MKIKKLKGFVCSERKIENGQREILRLGNYINSHFFNFSSVYAEKCGAVNKKYFKEKPLLLIS